jgi:hypothetical protein
MLSEDGGGGGERERSGVKKKLIVCSQLCPSKMVIIIIAILLFDCTLLEFTDVSALIFSQLKLIFHLQLASALNGA